MELIERSKSIKSLLYFLCKHRVEIKLSQYYLFIMDPEFYKNLLTIPSQHLQNAVQGGIIISLASSLYYMLFGGILGMSGMAGSIVKFPTREATKVKAIVIVGIIIASALLNTLFEYKKILHIPFDNFEFTLASSTTKLIVAGALVGVGTELSNGCTSGHGLCGLPRLSIRSFTAVMVFLSTAIVTATYSFGDYIPEIPQLRLSVIENLEINPLYYLAILAVAVAYLFYIDVAKPFIAKIALLCIGIIFGCGLMIAGMSQRTKIYGFLELNKDWDPSLLFVLMTGVMINLVTFTLIKKLLKQPKFGEKLEDPHGKVTFKLIIGALIFGLGWGLGGLCPGPFLLSIPNSFRIAFYWGVPFFFSHKLTSMFFGDGHKHHEPKHHEPKHEHHNCKHSHETEKQHKQTTEPEHKHDENCKHEKKQ